MNLLKKLWNFLFGKEEEPLVLEELVEEVVNHCASHLRFRKNCPECIKLVGVNV